MKQEWALFVHLNEGDPFVFPTDPILSSTLPMVSSLLDHYIRALRRPATALRLALARLAAHHHLRWTSITPFHSTTNTANLFCHALSSSITHLFGRPDDAHSLPFLSLAAAVMPPFHFTWTPNLLAIPHKDATKQMPGSPDQTPCDRVSCCHSFPDLNWVTHIVEPRTGIEFPAILDSILPNEYLSTSSSEVLVGTGSRIMTLIKIKTLKIYAFGFYVHPNTVCQKLGSKYASVPVADLKDRNDFYKDLLREDIGMTVRLVVNCNGMKINTVKDAFEKSLRARLLKTNPDTDFKCIATFGSYFTTDIPLPVGTIIDIRRTEDGQLITLIGGNQIGAVHSRELCRAFFDMYLGELPVSTQTKEEIGTNVASIIRRC